MTSSERESKHRLIMGIIATVMMEEFRVGSMVAKCEAMGIPQLVARQMGLIPGPENLLEAIKPENTAALLVRITEMCAEGSEERAELEAEATRQGAELDPDSGPLELIGQITDRILDIAEEDSAKIDRLLDSI